MLFLISLAIALTVAFLLDKPLKKRPAVFYITAGVLTVVTIIIEQSDIEITSRFIRDYVLGIFTRGALGAAFWAVVMWAGALPNGSAPIKKLMPIRGELSITAAILTFSHIITYGMIYITNLIKGRTGSDFILTSAVCLIMVLIMIPLTVMSFKTIRKKMNARTWKKIQRLAYIFYAFIYIHIIVLFVPKAQKGREGYFLSVLVYSLVFIGYAVMRIRKAYIAEKKPENRTLPNIICTCAMIIPLSLVGVVSRNKNNDSAKVVNGSEDSSVVYTFTNSAASETATTTTEANIGKTTSETAESTETSAAITTVETTSTEEKTEEETTTADETSAEEQHDEPEQEQHEETQPETEPQVTYKYRNGEYEAEAEGYAGTVHVKLTIENDTITSISAWADDDDPEYFNDAMNTIIPQIASKVSADGIDACSGATYSSNGVIEAARKALEQAKN
ncbi:DMSO/TMAO reductase YedYZ, heme-binding membrane subunit [Ruminococcus sp. YRD2003]|uniref:FMN-binding protein n=1 Tax=Ruminococcus sp. YRD2003 TaxID=1452313 RepID=UPI0008BE1D17|nr:DMSO/TMAO reductase YedYZ, heme-binding membrane subunit [Ruminococcus flavefaciens]